MASSEVELMETWLVSLFLFRPRLMASSEVELMETLGVKILPDTAFELMASSEVELMETISLIFSVEEPQTTYGFFGSRINGNPRGILAPASTSEGSYGFFGSRINGNWPAGSRPPLFGGLMASSEVELMETSIYIPIPLHCPYLWLLRKSN